MRPRFAIAGLALIAVAVPLIQAQTGISQISPGTKYQLAEAITPAADRPISGITSPDAQDTPRPGSSSPSVGNGNGEPICGISHLVRCIKDLGEDDKGIFTSPLRVKSKNAYWLMPLGAAAGLAFANDTNAEQAAGVDASRTDTANTIANFGSFYATGAEGAAIYFVGLAKKNPKLAETGRLAAEAVIDSGTVTIATKLVSDRQRPLEGNGQGDFWAGGPGNWNWDSSFPSDHATATMSLARVVAGEYPHWYVMIPAYGFAETVSISRILANQHFPSDVIVGQAVGFLVGTYVLNHRGSYRPRKNDLAGRLLNTITPVTNARTRTIGASMQIPFPVLRGH